MPISIAETMIMINMMTEILMIISINTIMTIMIIKIMINIIIMIKVRFMIIVSPKVPTNIHLLYISELEYFCIVFLSTAKLFISSND